MSDEIKYSRLLSWEVWNFMSVEHGKLEFDEKNIINIKGYNDSGKSALLQALRVLFTNSDNNSQVKFIQDGKNYFRVLASFDDGVAIMRDKYINGQSLYEMYKDGVLVFTTKSENGACMKVTKVPDIIENYLGLVLFDGKALNIRSCFEKQLGVQTSGSENYQMFNQVLKSEEIASASTMLNIDKNKKSSEITRIDNELQANKSMLANLHAVTKETLDGLKALDSSLDEHQKMLDILQTAQTADEQAEAIEIMPELESIDGSDRLASLDALGVLEREIESISILPILDSIDNTRVSLLASIQDIDNSIRELNLPPKLTEVSSLRVSALMGIASITEGIEAEENTYKALIQKDAEIKKELAELAETLKEQGVTVTRCPNCGEYFNSAEGGHTHEH